MHYGFSTGPPTSSHCEICNHTFQVAGPIWSGELHEHGFVDAMLEYLNRPGKEKAYGTEQRIKGMLTLARHVRTFSTSLSFFNDVSHLLTHVSHTITTTTTILAGTCDTILFYPSKDLVHLPVHLSLDTNLCLRLNQRRLQDL